MFLIFRIMTLIHTEEMEMLKGRVGLWMRGCNLKWRKLSVMLIVPGMF